MCQNETASGEAWDCWTVSVTEMERAKVRGGREGGMEGGVERRERIEGEKGVEVGDTPDCAPH